MKIIYRGGYNSTLLESIKKSFWYDYFSLIEGLLQLNKKVCVVTLAKLDGYYNDFIAELPFGVETVDSKSKNIDWATYDAIFLPGGDSLQLFEGLTEKGFSLNKLKSTALILGDSAGAYVLSSYFYSSPPGENRGKILKFCKGFNQAPKIITIAHTNNPFYSNQVLLDKVDEFSTQNNLQVLKLEENQEKLLDENGILVDFDRTNLL